MNGTSRRLVAGSRLLHLPRIWFALSGFGVAVILAMFLSSADQLAPVLVGAILIALVELIFVWRVIGSGVDLSENELVVQRILGRTAIPLQEIRDIVASPDAQALWVMTRAGTRIRLVPPSALGPLIRKDLRPIVARASRDIDEALG